MSGFWHAGGLINDNTGGWSGGGTWIDTREEGVLLCAGFYGVRWEFGGESREEDWEGDGYGVEGGSAGDWFE